MRYPLIIITIMFLVACSDPDKSDVTDAEKKTAHDKLYKTPPPSDRSKDKAF